MEILISAAALILRERLLIAVESWGVVKNREILKKIIWARSKVNKNSRVEIKTTTQPHHYLCSLTISTTSRRINPMHTEDSQRRIRRIYHPQQ